MDGVLVLDRGVIVDIEFIDPAVKQAGLRALIDAADREGSGVQVHTGGVTRTFRVTRTVAEAAGFLPVPPTGGLPPATDPEDLGTQSPVVEPPRSGKGASKTAWQEFLSDQGVDVPELGSTRDQLIALWDQAKEQ